LLAELHDFQIKGSKHL